MFKGLLRDGSVAGCRPFYGNLTRCTRHGPASLTFSTRRQEMTRALLPLELELLRRETAGKEYVALNTVLVLKYILLRMQFTFAT